MRHHLFFLFAWAGIYFNHKDFMQAAAERKPISAFISAIFVAVFALNCVAQIAAVLYSVP